MLCNTLFCFSSKNPEYKGKGVAHLVESIDAVLHLANTYAKNHKTMTADNCNQTGTFPNGIINGAYWRNMPGRRKPAHFNDTV